MPVRVPAAATLITLLYVFDFVFVSRLLRTGVLEKGNGACYCCTFCKPESILDGQLPRFYITLVSIQTHGVIYTLNTE